MTIEACTERGNYTLVVGVDGSGKSTFLDGLTTELGIESLEQTGSPEVRQFRKDNIETMIDSEFVDTRERLFENLNGDFDEIISQRLTGGYDVACAGTTLVTAVSHGVMRRIVDPQTENPVDYAIGKWQRDCRVRPSTIALIHAPKEVICARIMARQAAGDETERFWGFNSPFFLERYQEAWYEAVRYIGEKTSVQCIELDSSQLDTPQMIERFVDLTAYRA